MSNDLKPSNESYSPRNVEKSYQPTTEAPKPQVSYTPSYAPITNTNSGKPIPPGKK